MAELRIAYRQQRPVEARLSASFDYAPWTNTRGSEEDRSPDLTSLSQAQFYLFEADRNSYREDGQIDQALGLYYLTQKQFDKAIKKLDSTLRISPNDAKALTDLGAAFLEKAKIADADKNGEEFFKNVNAGLENLNRALEINANYPEALFNRALILQMMRVPNQAKEAWKHYLEQDPSSLWADEARTNLESLNRKTDSPKDKSTVLEDFLGAYRNDDDTKAWRIISETKEFVTGVMVSQQLAGNFLESTEQGDLKTADEMLAAFMYLGRIESEKAEDPYFSDLANYYKTSSASQRRTSYKAHLEVQKAQQELLKPDFTKALEIFTRAKDLFASAGNLWEAGLVEYQICYSLTQLDRLKESNERLFLLSSFNRHRNYRWLQALADGWIGSNYLNLGEISKSIQFDQKSLEIAESISDVYKIQRSYIGLAEQYRRIDNRPKALNNIYNSLVYPTEYFLPPRQNWRNLFFTSEILYSFDFFDSAVIYAQEEIALAENELKDNWMKHSGLIHAATINGRLKKYKEAIAQAETSLNLADSFPDAKMGQRLKGKSLISLGHLQRQSGNCAEAINSYNQAIRIYDEMQFTLENYQARKGRLLCLAEGDDDSSVRQEIPELLKLFDDNRQKIADETDRNIYFDDEQSVYDIATDYAFTSMKDTEKAFDYAEQSRARSLLNLVGGDLSKPLSLDEIRQNTPNDVQIVYYALLKDRLLIWHISDKNVSMVEKVIDRSDLEAKISEYSGALTSRLTEKDVSALAEELYEIVIKPVESHLDKGKTICFIADKSLFRLAFASLISPTTKKYLVEDHAIFLSPSASIFVKQTEFARKMGVQNDETVLSIGNPSFSGEEYPNLSDLPEASGEAREIAANYRKAKVFIEKDASKDKIINNFSDADIVHFAGHYIANIKSPSRSKLILAATGAPSGKDNDLAIEEIMQHKLLRTRLIVLAACDTGVEKFYNGEGMVGAARAFLAAGVPLVVGSQWKVDSDATTEIMVKFHQYRKQQGLSTIEALRRVQIDIINDKNSRWGQPYYWAGFLPIGAYTTY